MPGLSTPSSLRPVLVCAAFALAGCASLQSEGNVLGLITPYRIDIVQGNVVTKEQLALVKPGMSRVQVRDLLGSPLVTDMFHADRWDYVFTIRRPGTEPQRRSIVAWFDGEQLKKLDAPDAVPAEREFVAAISRPGARGALVPLELTEEQRKALPVPAQRPQETAPGVLGPARTYPPLEPN